MKFFFIQNYQRYVDYTTKVQLSGMSYATSRPHLSHSLDVPTQKLWGMSVLT